MAITTADGWFGAARDAQVRIRKIAAVTSVAAGWFTALDVAGTPGAGSLAIGNTTAGIVPTDLTAGFPELRAFGGGASGYLAAASYRGSVAGGCILYDRVFHVGSVLLTALATTTLAAQPSYAGRMPGGVYGGDLELILEVNAAVSATATTVSVNYTNEAAVAARTTGASPSLTGYLTRRCHIFPLQAGDKSVSKIESITVGGVVATTGSVNIIVARRLAEFDVRAVNGLDAQGWDLLGAPQVFADSALWPLFQPDSTSTGFPSISATVING